MVVFEEKAVDLVIFRLGAESDLACFLLSFGGAFQNADPKRILEKNGKGDMNSVQNESLLYGVLKQRMDDPGGEGYLYSMSTAGLPTGSALLRRGSNRMTRETPLCFYLCPIPRGTRIGICIDYSTFLRKVGLSVKILCAAV